MCQSTIGLPAIRNYRNTDYHASIENWDIAQDKNGLLYFANNDGLLSYDGSYWKLYPLPNKAAIKSLAIDPEGRIYIGGQDEVGYFFPNGNGILTYHSLKEKLPKIAQQFADIWNIVLYEGNVFFRTNEVIFELTHNTMRTFDAPGGWQLLAKADGKLFAADKTKGLYVFGTERWQEVNTAPAAADLHITGIMDYKKDSLLVTTLKTGLWMLTGTTLVRRPTAVDGQLMNDLINNARKIGEDGYAIGTSTGGIFIFDGNGSVTQHYSSGEGLQNNHILSVLSDEDANLWLGLQNGIALIHYNTAVQQIEPVKDNQLMSNVIRIFDRRLFIGTSNGLYSVPLDPTKKDISAMKGVFTEVSNTKGQVWSLEEIDHELLMGHQDGGFVIKDNKAIPIMTKQGVWDFKKGPWAGGRIVAGTYTGLEFVEQESGKLSDGGRADTLYESLPVIAVEGEAIWTSHPYRGVFKHPMGTPASPGKPTLVRHYTYKDGLPSDLNNSVQVLGDKVVAATEKGVYEYYAGPDRWAPSAMFTPMFHDTSVEYLQPDQNGNIWFVSNQRVGVIDFSKPAGGRRYSVVFIPELTGQTVKGAAFIYPYDQENIFIGSNHGVYHLNYSRYISTGRSIRVLLGTVKAIAEKDSLIYGGVAAANHPPRLPSHWNSFHFEYSSPSYAQEADVEFSYQLAGFDKEWSEWSGRTEKDYTNLPYGKYTFYVKARDHLGNVSTAASYTFIVNPAWYQTIWAYLCYLLLGLWCLYAVRQRQQRRLAIHQKKYEEEQERLNYLHSLELDRKEKGLIALQNSKLEGELQFKNKELATVTMYLVERGGLLSNIKEELLAVIKKPGMSNLAHELRNVFRMITDTEQSSDDWDRFALYFDQVHNNFLSTLKTKFPQLSPTDLKLCAYLRLNLSSKEIAQLLNISLKGVEVSRYRLRKKLNLPTEINLHDFLIEATGGA
jgi:hypothetical protein